MGRKLGSILRQKSSFLLYERILSLKDKINEGLLSLNELIYQIKEDLFPQKDYDYVYLKIKRLANKYPEINELVKKAKENKKLKRKKRKRMLEKAKQTAKEIILGVLNDKQSKGLTLTELYNLLKEKGYKLTWREFKKIIEEIEEELFGEERDKVKEPTGGKEQKELSKAEKELLSGKEKKEPPKVQEFPKKGTSLAIPDDFDWESYAKTLAETNPEEWDLKPLLSLHPPKRRYRFLYYAVVPRVKDFLVFSRGIEKIFRKIGLEPVEYTDLVKMVYAWQNRKKKAELFDVVQKYKQDFENAIKKGIEIAKGGELD